jgi:hypothetical protein
MTSLLLSGARDARDLGGYLERLLRFDRRAAVRLQAHRQALEVFGRPPFDVICLRTLSLAEPGELDVTVSAGELLDGIEAVQAQPATPRLSVPPHLAAIAWAGVMPPRSGWQRLAEAPAESVVRAVADGVAAFRSQVERLGPEERSRAVMDRIAAEVWARPVLSGVPLRAAHAAHALGFLAPRGKVVAHGCAGWLRLEGTHGSVAMRRSGRPGPRLA